MRRAAKTDLNHKSIMNECRKLGCMVASLHQLGGGIPDLVVQVLGVTILVEVKQTKKSTFTPAQIAFYRSWQVYTVTSPQDVAELVKSIRKTHVEKT